MKGALMQNLNVKSEGSPVPGEHGGGWGKRGMSTSSWMVPGNTTRTRGDGQQGLEEAWTQKSSLKRSGELDTGFKVDLSGCSLTRKPRRSKGQTRGVEIW